MTAAGQSPLLCFEELEDPAIEDHFNPESSEFCADLVYYFSLLAPNQSPPVLPRSSLRIDLVDWILKVSSKTQMSRETAQVAVFIFDKSLSLSSDQRSISLLLLAMTSLMLSSKFLEKKPLLIKVLNEYSDYQFSQKDIVKTEFKCLNACNFKMPSTTFARWLDFLTEKWDQFVKAAFLVPFFEPVWEEPAFQLIFFRRQDPRSYSRLQKVYALCDLMCLSNQFYAFDHRMLAFAVVWKVVYHEFVADDMKFYLQHGVPSTSGLFGIADCRGSKSANDWIFELLREFSNVYIGDASVELAQLFEVVDCYLNLLPKVPSGYEKYLKNTDPQDRSYEHFLGLQFHSPSYLKIAKYFN
jgi:hypothetical protein